MGRVMLVGFSNREEKNVVTYFRTVGVECETLPKIENAIERLSANPPTLIITKKPDQIESLYGLKSVLQTSSPTTPFLVVLPEAKASEGLASMNAGAYDCLSNSLDRFHVLAAAKRATAASGRTLFGAKVKRDKMPWTKMVFCVLVSFVVCQGLMVRWNGEPAKSLNLASATLSGIQWEDRSLWVGNWFESTITHYVLQKGLLARQRTLVAEEIFRMQDSQPILVCDTPDALVTVGFDLKMRTHQRAVGLPTIQTASAPGPNPTGIAWDGEYLWSSDGQTGLLYKHGSDLRVLGAVKSLIGSPAGLTCDGHALWVMGGAPLSVAKLERIRGNYVWRGPFRLSQFLPPDVPPAGMAIGFDRLWVVTGGTPHMISRPLKDIVSQIEGWK